MQNIKINTLVVLEILLVFLLPAKHIANGDEFNCKSKEHLNKAKLLKASSDKTFDQRKIPGEYDVLTIGQF